MKCNGTFGCQVGAIFWEIARLLRGLVKGSGSCEKDLEIYTLGGFLSCVSWLPAYCYQLPYTTPPHTPSWPHTYHIHTPPHTHFTTHTNTYTPTHNQHTHQHTQTHTPTYTPTTTTTLTTTTIPSLPQWTKSPQIWGQIKSHIHLQLHLVRHLLAALRNN